MSNVVHMAAWALSKGRKFGSQKPLTTHRTHGLAPSQELTPGHHSRGYRSRRAYFWEMSETYGIPVDVIESKGMALGSDEDFGLLLTWLRNNDTRRNR